MGEHIPSPPAIEVSDSQYQKIGLQCISPGIATSSLDTERLQTFNKSKYIALQQQKQIRRMNLDSLGESGTQEGQEDHEKEDEDGEQDHEKEDDDDGDEDRDRDREKEDGPDQEHVSTPDTSTSLSMNASSSKSLRRNNIPKPLSLKSQGSGAGSASASASASASGSGPYPNIRSAPPMVTKHTIPVLGPHSSHQGPINTASGYRIAKPRVIYRGRSTNRGYPLLPPGSLGAPLPMFQTSSPIAARAMATPASLRSHAQGPGPRQAPMTAYPVGYPQTQRSFEQFMANPVRASNSVTRDVFKDETTRIAPLSVQPKSTKREFFDAIEIEDHSNNVVIEGDIRLMGENFQFQFDSIDPSMDKKMFLSICSKIWTDVVSRN
ncbi:hypothetical protein FIM1_3889 [Kluyveromyces marxianus]|uniref:Uncharacterized protein n=1 Tax=Kluyveromyces marxianus TaxID=4911 RepID=A0ABX6F1E4_KLUMA|nr:hypothetical protein FIM1_3889 [Kluyveromyces marxianus]